MIDNASNVDLVSGTGTAYRYTVGASAPYDAPDETPNWLELGSPDGWIETQPDGLRYHYDASGKLIKLVNHVGQIWTVSYVAGGSSVKDILNPANNRTTFHYNAATSRLDAIQDFAGRRTTLTLTGSPLRLTKITSPELCETNFLYDGSGRLQARVSPGGGRTTYSYDVSNRVQNVAFAGGGTSTYAYSGNNTIFTDPRGKISTFLHTAPPSMLLSTIIDPTGQRTTLTWTGKLLRTVMNPLGQVTTFGYRTFAKRLISGDLSARNEWRFWSAPRPLHSCS